MWLMLLHELDSHRRAAATAAAATTTPKEKESMKWVRETCPSVSEYNYLDNGGGCAEEHWRWRRQRRHGGAAAGRGGLAAAAAAVGGLAKNGGDSGNLPTTAAVALVCSRQRKLKNTQLFFSTLVDCDGKNLPRRLRHGGSGLALLWLGEELAPHFRTL